MQQLSKLSIKYQVFYKASSIKIVYNLCVRNCALNYQILEYGYRVYIKKHKSKQRVLKILF